MAVPVRIPGPDSIDAVAPARDPGVRADPNDFGANIGESLSHFGNAAVEVGALLDQKREAAAAAMAIPEATAKFQLDAITKRQQQSKTMPTSAAGAGTDLNNQLLPSQDQIVADTKAKYNLSDLNVAKLTGHLTTLRGHAVVSGVTDANNQIVSGLGTAHNETVQTIASNALATGDVDGALKQVDASVAAMRGVVPENDLNIQATKSKKVVVDAVISGLNAKGTKEAFDQAEALTQRFYGSVPSQTSEPAKSAMQFFQGRGYTKEQAAGIVGNLSHESDFKTSASGDNGTAFGIAQWRGDRLEGLKTYAASKGKPTTDFQTQLEYVDQELNSSESGAKAKLSTAKSTQEATQAFLAYERPKDWDTANPHGWDNRLRQAQSAAGEMQIAGKAELPDTERALYWNQKVGSAKTKTLATASADTENQFTRQIIDANAGVGPLPSRSAIESNSSIGEDTRNSLLAKYDSAASDVIKLQNAMKKFTDPNGGGFNPFDKEDKGNVDRIYNALGGDLNALQTVNSRTGMVPASAGTALRGALVSNDPAKVAPALTIASNLLNKNPNALTGIGGQEDIEKAATTFQHYVEHYGMTAEAAAQEVIKQQAPEYKADRAAKIKNEDIDQIVKKQVSVSDLAGAFNESTLGKMTFGILGKPAADFTPEGRKVAYSDYVESFRDHYLEGGDVNLAKKLAANDMKKVWGVSELNGGSTIMRYPPEKAAAYAGVPNVAAAIAMQAQDEIAKATNPNYRGRDFVAKPTTETIMATPTPGYDAEALQAPSAVPGEVTRIVPPSKEDLASQKAAAELIPRDKIMLTPISGYTARAYTKGDPVPYALSWFDKEGNIQTLNPGKAFVPDADMMRAQVSEQRRAALEAGAARLAPGLDHRETMQANREKVRDEARQRIAADRNAAGPDTAVVIP